MDEKEKLFQTSDFDLDEILKEFGATGEDVADEDVRIWGGELPDILKGTPGKYDTIPLEEIQQAIQKQQAEPVSEDTLRMPALEQQETVRIPALDQRDTVRIPAATTQDTVRFTPVAEQPPVYVPPVVPQQEKVEPYSDKWEPEYEQPISDYVPLQPIVFRPKNRLRELKKQLVEGPERRYYELEEQGIGKLQAAIFLSLLVFLASAATVVMHQLGMITESRMRLLVFGQVLMMLLSALLGSYQLLEGIGDLFLRRRFSLNTLLVFSLIASCIDGVLCLRSLRLPCSVVFCLHVSFSLISAYQKRTTEQSQMDTLRKAVRLDSLVPMEDYFDGRIGYLRGEGQVEDFMDNYEEVPGPEKVVSVYAILVLLLSLAAGIWVGLHSALADGVRIFGVLLLTAMPASAHILSSRPAALLQRRLKKHGTVICGWQGVRDLCGSAVFPLTNSDLFPSGSAKLNGVKFYGDREPDQVVAYATALMVADGGSMAPLMTQLLESRSGYHYDVTELQSYPGGIGGIVNDEAVLAGSMTFLQNMGVELPKGTKVNQAVYVSIDGQFSGVFAVTYSKVKAAAAGLTTLCSYRRLTPVMVTGDFMLSDSFLRAKFGVNTKRIAFPDRATRAELAEKQADPENVALALTTQDGLAGMAYAVTGARALRSACIAGAVVHLLGGVLGIAIVAALLAVNATYLLSPANLLLYQLAWMIPGWLISEWTRSV